MNYNNFSDYFSHKFDIDEKERTITHVITNETINRHRQLVRASGMDDKSYSSNPIVLFNHGGDWMATGETVMLIGSSLWRKQDNKDIIAKTKFATTQLANDVWQLNVDGHMRAWSIGFNVDEYTINEKEEYIDITKWQMLEYSGVYIPANPEALNIRKNNFEYMRNSLSVVKSPILVNAIQNKHLEIEAQSEVQGLTTELNNLKAELKSYKDSNDVNKIIQNYFKQYHETSTKNLLEIVADNNGKIIDSVKNQIPLAVSGAIRQALGKVD